MDFLFDGPETALLTVVLAHGAGAPMDTPFMDFFARALAAQDLRVARFEFPYMAARRADGKRRGPDRAPVLLEAWREAVRELGPAERLAIGGKSMGGRIASMVADEFGVRALVCLGYPFHPPGRPEATRTAHLEHLQTPALIVQGTRDPFGSREDVAAYSLAAGIRIHWIEEGDHDLSPARTAAARSAAWAGAAEAVAGFLAELEPWQGPPPQA
jgi:predicted alpha/beta-hydrolase family hydrolase